MPPVAGVTMTAAACGVKYQGRTDVLLMAFAPGTTAAGVFTRSLTASAAVDWCRKCLPGGLAQALIVNSGNANAFTGRQGEDAVERVVEAVADVLACRPSRVFAASTGVIGEPLDFETITSKAPDLAEDLAEPLAPGDWEQAARAIMTTDTFPKGAARTVEIGGTPVQIAGIAKGSGMIAPDMATMLGYVVTDAALPAGILQKILEDANGRTFNCITVDGDTSTSDTVMAFATGQADHSEITGVDDPALSDFKAGFEAVLLDLAQQIVRDGEGATKFVTIEVRGAENDPAARTIGLAIANSPLVKTAIAGEDANWGRVVMAVGKAGERADRDRLTIAMGGVTIAENGLAVSGYDEAPVAEHMKGQNIDIAVDVGVGTGKATVWTCDLTHGYITINADYRS